MADLYEALISQGGAGNNSAVIAAALRRRNQMGTLGQLTGDSVLGPAGAGLSKSADNYAELLQQTAQDTRRQDQTQQYQTGQLDHMRDSLAETKRNNDLDHEYQMAMARAAGIKAEKPGAGRKLTLGDRTKLEELATLINNTRDTIGAFKPEYTQAAGPGPQSKLVNSMAAHGFGTKGTKEAANWWGAWNLIYTLPERNAKFGATLTDTERQAWAESDINPSMDKEQIAARAGKILKILEDKGALVDRTYRSQFDPEDIDQYGLVSGPQVGPAGAPAQPAQSGFNPGKAPKRVRVDAQGNTLP